MNGAQESRNQARFAGPREHADGISCTATNVDSEAPNHRDREAYDEKTADRLKAYEKEKSEWIKQETKLLEEIENLKQEIRNLRHQLSSRRDLDIPHVQPLDPRQPTEPPSCIKLVQRLLPQIKSLKSKVLEQNEQIKSQRGAIENLRRRCESLTRGVEARRLLPSMESATGHIGGMSNSNYTLSLNPQYAYTAADRLPVGATADVEKYTKYSADTGFSTSASDQRLTFDRRGPVEQSDHDYSNHRFGHEHHSPHTLVDENISKPIGPASPTRRSGRAPVPMPRNKSLRSQQPPSSASDSFAIVDRTVVASAIPSRLLGDISERDSTSKPSTSNDQPTWLTQNVVQAPCPESDYEKAHGRESPELRFEASPTKLNVGLPETTLHSLTRETSLAAPPVFSSQICDVCHEDFPEMANRQFLDHCLECAERAAALEGGPSSSHEVQGDRRDCPLCSQTFGPQVSQTDFENHVQSHFRDEDTLAAGWENVGRA